MEQHSHSTGSVFPSRFLTTPGCCSGVLPLYSGTHHFSLSAISGFLFVIAPTIHKPTRYRNSSSYFYGSLHFYRKARDSSSIPKSHSANIPFREAPLFRKIQRKRIYKAILSDSPPDILLSQQGSDCKRKRQIRVLCYCIQ